VKRILSVSLVCISLAGGGLVAQQGVQGKVNLPGAVRIIATGHTIDLSWNASPSSSVTYSVYRSKAHGGPYSRIVSAISGLSYTDQNVARGTSYYYVVTAVSGPQESGYSNESAVSIP
jgi:fibronectin type 3 domain-containing protein